MASAARPRSRSGSSTTSTTSRTGPCCWTSRSSSALRWEGSSRATLTEPSPLLDRHCVGRGPGEELVERPSQPGHAELDVLDALVREVQPEEAVLRWAHEEPAPGHHRDAVLD